MAIVFLSPDAKTAVPLDSLSVPTVLYEILYQVTSEVKCLEEFGYQYWYLEMLARYIWLRE